MSTYLIDTENVATAWLPIAKTAQRQDRIVLFYTDAVHHQNLTIPELAELSRSVCHIDAIYCFCGSNALDFQLVSELGRMIAKRPAEHYFILSRDTGYDSVTAYWDQQNIHVTRIEPEKPTEEKQPAGKPKQQAPSRPKPVMAGKPKCQSIYNQKARSAGIPTEETNTIANILANGMLRPIQGRSLWIQNQITKKFGSKKGRHIFNTIKPIIHDIQINGPLPKG